MQRAAKLAVNPVGESPTRGECPVATVVIFAPDQVTALVEAWK